MVEQFFILQVTSLKKGLERSEQAKHFFFSNSLRYVSFVVWLSVGKLFDSQSKCDNRGSKPSQL